MTTRAGSSSDAGLRRERFAPALNPSYVWHLVRHDLASLKPFLGAWAGVLMVQSLVLRMGPPIPDGSAGPAMSLDIAALVMRFALTVVLVSVLVSRHPVVDNTAFWRTRPMPRADVLASTLVALALVTVLVPYAWGVLTFWWLGFDLAHSAVSAVPVAIEQTGFASVALLLAALTRNPAQAIVAVLAVAVVLVLGRQALMMLAYRPLSFGLIVRQTEWTAALPVVAASAAWLLLAAHQYLTLKTGRSFVLAAALVALVVAGSRFPLVRWAPTRAMPAAAVSLETPAVHFDRNSVRSETVSRLSPSGKGVGISQSALFEDPAPTGAVVLKPLAVQTRLKFPDGAVERFDSQSRTPWVNQRPEASPSRQPWASLSIALGGVDVLGTREAQGARFRATFLELPPETYAQRLTQPALLDINITAEAYRYDVLVSLPLTGGARSLGPGYVLEFEGTASAEQGVAVLVRETFTPDQFSPRPTFYALLNTKRRQAVLATEMFTERFRSVITHRASPVVCRNRLEFNIDPQRLTFDTEWLAEAAVVVLRPTSLGRVIRGVREYGYTLAPPA